VQSSLEGHAKLYLCKRSPAAVGFVHPRSQRMRQTIPRTYRTTSSSRSFHQLVREAIFDRLQQFRPATVKNITKGSQNIVRTECRTGDIYSDKSITSFRLRDQSRLGGAVQEAIQCLLQLDLNAGRETGREKVEL